LIIRADASAEIGLGHVMRCAALAQAWQSAGGRSIFALASGAQELESRFRSWGSEVALVHAKPGSADDAAQTLQICQGHSADWLVLDGYDFSESYRTGLQGGVRLLFVDDHGGCPTPTCDIVLNANPQASAAMYEGQGGRTRLLLGSRYALLRQEFLAWRAGTTEIPEISRRILVTFGGGDPDNVTLKVMQALQEIRETRLEVTIVLGAVNPHLESINMMAGQLSHTVRVLSDVANMPHLFSQSDLAVTAGGGTCYELAFMQVPMFLIIIAENQERTVQALCDARAALSQGWFNSLDRQSLAVSLLSMICDQRLRRELRESASRLVDGRGAQRVVEAMYETDPLEGRA
jgi:UDP-2,4-diacetamido-2,4,6-trideoxy-beta-L-altropyranose hydrolase